MVGSADVSGRKPTRTIQIPDKMLPTITPHDVNRYTNLCKTEANATDVDIIPQWNRGPRFNEIIPRKLVALNLYGPACQADAAVRRLNKWMENLRGRSDATARWAKQKAFDPNKWYYEEVNQLEKERKQKFKGPPPDGDGDEVPFEVIIPWPEELLNPGINRNPCDAFGNKLEQLDPIRTQDEVFITIHSRRPWQIKIQGYEAAHVERAAKHYNNKVASIQRKFTGGSAATNIILDEGEGTEVSLQFSDNWWPNSPQIVPKLVTSLLESGGFRNRLVDLEEIQEEIRDALEAIRYRAGSYDLAIRFGCLSVAFKSLPRMSVPLSNFRNLIRGSVDCKVCKWLGDTEFGHRLLACLMKSENFLELKQTRPTFKVRCVVKDPNRPVLRTKQPPPRNPGRPLNFKTKKNQSLDQNNAEPANYIVIQLEWTEDEEGIYEKMPPTYYRLKPGVNGPQENMDVNLLELTESKAWHFGLDSMDLMPKSTVHPTVSDLAKSVELTPEHSQNLRSTARFIRLPANASVECVETILERLYTFTIKGTGYQVEFSEKWYHGRNVPLCGLSVRHIEWATHLSSLEALAPGGGADWDQDVIKHFFPKDGISSAEDGTPGDGEGLRLLIKKLMELSKIVQSVSHPTPTPSPQRPPPQQRNLGGRSASLNLIDLDD